MNAEDYDEAVAAPSRRKPVIGAAVAAALVVAGLAVAIGSEPTRSISGVPVASTAEVSRYTDEVKAQEALAAKEAKAAALDALEQTTRDDMQEYFDRPSNAMSLPIKVIEVGLVGTSETRFDGMANMQAGNYEPRWISITVTADDRGGMWHVDAGWYLALLR